MLNKSNNSYQYYRVEKIANGCLKVAESVLFESRKESNRRGGATGKFVID
jgi:hypothetical protein